MLAGVGGGGGGGFFIINIMEYKRWLSYLSSVYTVLYERRQLINNIVHIFESCVFENFSEDVEAI